jgi:hypothetical protein
VPHRPEELRFDQAEEGIVSAVSGTAVLAETERGGGRLADVVERRSLRQESDPGALACSWSR